MHKLFMPVFALAILACSTGRCFARLGETEAELEKRYGKPWHKEDKPKDTRPADKKLFFTKSGTIVQVAVFDGRSVIELYVFKDSDRKDVAVRDEFEKATALLDANAEGATWESKLPPGNHVLMYWDRSDDAAYAAVFKSSPNVLQVYDMSFQREMTKHREQAKAGLDGF